MRLVRLLAGLFLFTGMAAAQFTTVSGTVTDPNGLPYANGTISATLVSSASPKFTATNQPYTPPAQPVGLNSAGSFVMQLADVTQLTPGGSTWSFTVNCGVGCVPPAGGKGPVSFTVPSITISGASQSITATLTAAALPLAFSGSGSSSTYTPPAIDLRVAPYNASCATTYAIPTTTTTSGTIGSGSTSVALASATNYAAGQGIFIAGAGAASAGYNGIILSVVSNTVTVSPATSTSVTNAAAVNYSIATRTTTNGTLTQPATTVTLPTGGGASF